MNREPNRRLLGWLLAPILLMACILPAASTPIATQQLPSPMPGSLDTIIAQTAAAAQTATVLHMTSLTSTQTATPTSITTSTPIPTVTAELITFAPTYTVNVPTLTQVLFTNVPQSQPQSQGTSISAPAATLSERDQRATNYPKVPVEWDCTITAKGPAKGTIIKPKSSVYLSWTIVNKGTKTWTNNGVDFVYTGGFGQDGRPIQDLPLTLGPGRSITLKVLVTAPKAPGSYNVYWSLKVGNRLFCHMKNTFEVK